MRFTRYAKAFHSGRKKGKNKTEEAYAGVLEGQKRLGLIQDFGFEEITLKIGPDVRYTGDFWILENDETITMVEVKAGMMDKTTGEVKPISEDASRIKIRVAAERFPFRFRIAYCHKKIWYSKEL